MIDKDILMRRLLRALEELPVVGKVRKVKRPTMRTYKLARAKKRKQKRKGMRK